MLFMSVTGVFTDYIVNDFITAVNARSAVIRIAYFGAPSPPSSTLCYMYVSQLRNIQIYIHTVSWDDALIIIHIADRFMVDDNRAIFMFKDGSQAWEAKDFLIEQERCKDVTIDNKVYEGKKAKVSRIIGHC